MMVSPLVVIELVSLNKDPPDFVILFSWHIASELKKNLKSKQISEDDEKKFEKIIQTYTDNFVKKIDEKVSSKEKEIMTI